jgi:hypothetical protein
LLAIGGTRTKAIGGTRAKAIGGTRAKAIGGTRAKAIGGTRAKAIGGTRAKAIGGTRAKAIGGTRAKAIGGTRAKAIGGTRAKAIGGTRAKGVAFSYALANLNDADAESYFFSSAELDADSSTSGRPLDRLVWNEMSYDWLIVGPAQVNSVGDTVSLPGVEADIPASNISTVSDAIASGEMLAILGYSDSKAVTVVPTGMPFIDGSTEIVFVGQVQSRSSDGTLTLANGLSVDTSGLREGTLEALSVGTWISVRGTYFSGM